jgi:hypothetical protein
MTYPTTPTINVSGLLNGPLVAFYLAPWEADYGADITTDYIDLGALKDISLSHEIKTTPVEADNVLPTIGVMTSGEELKLKAKLLQYDLKFMSRLTGTDTSGAAAVVVASAAGTDGTITFGRGATNTTSYFTARLHIEGQSMLFPSYGGHSGADTYTKVDIYIPKCRPVVKSDQAFKKGAQWEFPFELDAVYDSSVTTAGHELMKIVLTRPK